MNNYVIKLKNNRKLFFALIYSIKLVNLEILKTYFKINLPNSFIWSSKSFIEVPIIFDWEPDSNLQLCINYYRLNNFTIKNQYLLFLIDKLFG